MRKNSKLEELVLVRKIDTSFMVPDEKAEWYYRYFKFTLLLYFSIWKQLKIGGSLWKFLSHSFFFLSVKVGSKVIS